MFRLITRRPAFPSIRIYLALSCHRNPLSTTAASSAGTENPIAEAAHKDTFMSSNNIDQNDMKLAFHQLLSGINVLRSDMEDFRKDTVRQFNCIRTDVNTIRTDVNTMKSQLWTLGRRQIAFSMALGRNFES